MDQVDRYSPPPNPAKVTDTRAKDYIKRFGKTSWELDALEPQVLADLISTNIERYIDWHLWGVVAEQEAEVETILQRLSDNWPQIKANYL
ncbi:hypothetical protein [Marinobacterium jannaschii]|uniref:hypothetical protein n=1 Tax=Marinobacterium jannaschii TaxID=64970 RepID=UPI000A92F24E|nr:hypothetical protein [Marinobacterium jannaschii]